MKNLVLFPFGGNAREALLSILAQNRIKTTWNVLGFIDDDENLWERHYLGFKVLGGNKVIEDFPFDNFLAVPGNPRNFLKRRNIIEKLGLTKNHFATIIDPSVQVAPDSKIGTNTLIMANVVISCSVVIGDHCVILPNTVISHDSHIGDYTLIGSNVSISGSCNIAHTCYIGSGTKTRDNITIGPECLVGLGSCVIKDVPKRTVAAGNPAHFIKKVQQ